MITVISGTNRPEALTPSIAHQYFKIIGHRYPAMPTRFIDLRDLPGDFTGRAYASESPIAQMQETIDQSSHLAWIFPEYNGSFPGVLKFFLDGLRYPDTLPGKKGTMMALGAGRQGGALAMSHLNDILAYMGMFIGPLRIRVPRVYELLDASQTLTDKELVSLMEAQIDQLVQWS